MANTIVTYGIKSMTKKFTLSYEVVDNITKEVLLELYEELKDSQKKYDQLEESFFDELEDHQKEDYEYNKNLLDATKILICYYTTPDERPEELTDL